MNNSREIIEKVSSVTLAANLLLCAGKLMAGIAGHSSALISDAIHSLSDAGTTVLVIVGARIGSRKDDASHPYGHERFETMCLLLLASILVLVGGMLFQSGFLSLMKIRGGTYVPVIPGIVTLAAALVSILVKEAMYRYTLHYARRIHSSLLESDAVHHRSDALSSVGSFIGIFGAMRGMVWADAAASLFISVLIAGSGFHLLKTAVNELVDHAASPEDIRQITDIVSHVEGVRRVDMVKTRQFADKIYVDIEASVDPLITVAAGHTIAESIHAAVETGCTTVKHCHVHINPYR